MCLIYASSKSSWLWLLQCSAQRAAAASLACFRLELMIFVNIQRSSNASASQGRRNLFQIGKPRIKTLQVCINLRSKQVMLALVTAVQSAKSCCCKSCLFQIGVDYIREHSTICECLPLRDVGHFFKMGKPSCLQKIERQRGI